MLKFSTVLFLFCLVLNGLSQERNVQHAKVIGNDTVPIVSLPMVSHIEKRTWKTKRAQKKFSRLKKKVVKVYPYAHLAGQKMEEYAKEMEGIDKEKDKKKFYKQIEKELKAEFEGELKKLTISEGRILIKLIDRETGDSSYELVKDLRGKFSAFFWQSLARIFGHNLKSEYDPKGEDREIEFIVQQIENGLITTD